MQEDRFGYAVTSQSAQAAECYVRALDQLFSMQSAARQAIDDALAADPEFALAHSVNARVLVLEGNVRAAVAAAERGVELAGKASERERAHAELVAMVTRGENAAALPRVRAHAASYPRDALPLSFALGVYGLLGFGGFVDHHEQQLALLKSVQPHWDEDWWLLSWLGWSLVETGAWHEGISMLDRALELKPDNANAAHGRAHGYYESGAAAEGRAFLEGWLPGYAQHEPLHCHLAWHLALTLQQQGDFDTALAVYDEHIAPSVSAALPMFTMVDCAAFAWRRRLQGCALDSQRLAELKNFALEHFAEPSLPFVNLHGMLVRALTDPELAAAFADAVADRAHDGAPVGRLAAKLCAATGAFARADFAGAAADLQALSAELTMLGGSHAQRDLVVDTLIAALKNVGDAAGAERVARARSDTRARHLGSTWLGTLMGSS